jgi:[CysO sulfur-carrier protein]-S-L-cysteine hydrolase
MPVPGPDPKSDSEIGRRGLSRRTLQLRTPCEAWRDVTDHPGPTSVVLPPAIRVAMIEHAKAEYPNEMCGVVVGNAYAADGGRALSWEPARNAEASPMRYAVHPEDLLRLTIETDDADQVFWAIAHSHVRSPAVPSPTDIGVAQYPDALYILVSLSDDDVRAWRIVDGATHEVAITA